MPTTTIMIGNPGSGKSSLLSSLVGQPLFPSGISIGRGKTREIKVVEHNGDTYIDTPGLSDIKFRAKAASEIESAFKMGGGTFKIFFVMTLESGRVRPDDVATMKLVLDALPQMRPNKYSIVVNKLSQNIVSMLNESKEEKDELYASLVPPLIEHGTRSIFYVPLNQNLIDQSNQLCDLSPEFLYFISSAPSITISPNQVQNIQHDNFETICNSMREVLQDLREDNKMLRQAIAEREETFNKLQHTFSYGNARSVASASITPTVVFISDCRDYADWESSIMTDLVDGSVQFRPLFPIKDKTNISQTAVNNGTMYINTPGLSDCKEAASAIESIFKKGGNFKVFFFVKYKSGRIKSRHLDTIQLVLRAVTQIKDQYSVIITMSSQQYQLLRGSELGFSPFPPRKIIHCAPGGADWADRRSKPKESLLRFIEEAPEIRISLELVYTIQYKRSRPSFTSLLSL